VPAALHTNGCSSLPDVATANSVVGLWVWPASHALCAVAPVQAVYVCACASVL
jgi:hypothetical protein